jgi:hypothetical protein
MVDVGYGYLDQKGQDDGHDREQNFYRSPGLHPVNKVTTTNIGESFVSD